MSQPSPPSPNFLSIKKKRYLTKEKVKLFYTVILTEKVLNGAFMQYNFGRLFPEGTDYPLEPPASTGTPDNGYRSGFYRRRELLVHRPSSAVGHKLNSRLLLKFFFICFFSIFFGARF
jgi:hypothetical protein